MGCRRIHPVSMTKNILKVFLIFGCVYLVLKIADSALSSIFAMDATVKVETEKECPDVAYNNTNKNNRERILNDPQQFALEDSNLPYVVESYRTASLTKKVVRTMIYPIDAPCTNLVRFGITEPGGHDGHWVCADVLPLLPDGVTEGTVPKENSNPACLVYSFGVGYDFSFEDQIIRRYCEVHSFDPSMIFMDHIRGEGVWFHRLGLHDSDTDDYAPFLGGYVKEPQIWRVRTLETILDSFGHKNRSVTVLKVDIEGSEWRLVEYLLFEKPFLLQKIDQFIVEWHIGARQQKQIDAVLKLATLFRRCAGFSLVYADHWRRDAGMQAFLTTFVRSNLLKTQNLEEYNRLF